MSATVYLTPKQIAYLQRIREPHHVNIGHVLQDFVERLIDFALLGEDKPNDKA